MTGTRTELFYRLLADTILLLHVLVAVFIVFGLVLIVIGGMRHWSWVRNPWFRVLHLAAIGVVVVQAWLGALCPLTRWEMALRTRAGEAGYQGEFIAHWLQALLYYQAPLWVFALAYTLFALAVVYCWFRVRPRALFRQGDDSRDP